MAVMAIVSMKLQIRSGCFRKKRWRSSIAIRDSALLAHRCFVKDKEED
jgi:hypothetical protein